MIVSSGAGFKSAAQRYRMGPAQHPVYNEGVAGREVSVQCISSDHWIVRPPGGRGLTFITVIVTVSESLA
jgi:hypothetical protein